MKLTKAMGPLTQEKVVFAITVAMFVVFGLFLSGFLAPNNLLALLRSVSVLGILGMGMLIVVLGRRIDLSIVANMAISVATRQLSQPCGRQTPRLDRCTGTWRKAVAGRTRLR